MTVSANNLANMLAGTTRPAPTPAAQPHCRAGCGERLDPVLVDRPDGSGLHLCCTEPTQPAPAPASPAQPEAQAGEQDTPPSTVAELRDLLVNHEANSPRSVQKIIGPSEIGVACQRRLGYRILNFPQRRDTRVPWAPILGTALHAYIADMLTAHNEQLGRQRWIVEERVWPDDVISGSGDAFDTDTGTVIDWKLVGDNSLAKYRKQMRPEYRIQAHLYGLGHQRAGRDVRHVRIVCLHRSHDYDKSWEWTEPYNPQVAAAALERVYATMQLLSDLGVDNTPALWAVVPATPTPDCRYCPYWRPGKPADGTGCPGDTAATANAVARFTDGLIAA